LKEKLPQFYISGTHLFHVIVTQLGDRLTLAGCLSPIQLFSHSPSSTGQWDKIKQRDKDREIAYQLLPKQAPLDEN